MAHPTHGEWRKEEAWSFESYYDRWCDSVYRYLMHMLGRSSEVEDLFQETWMKALQHRKQLRRQELFGPWVMKIARNLALNHMRKQRQSLQIWILSNFYAGDGDSSEDFLERQPGAAPSPLECAIDSQRRGIIREAIGELDFATQEMLHLRYFEQRQLAEISEILDVPLGTVCTKIHRSLKQIRENLERKGFKGRHDL